MGLFSGIHRLISRNRRNIVGVIDFATGGAISRQEDARDEADRANQAAEDALAAQQLAKEQKAMNWDHALRGADINARQRDLQADAAGEQSRAQAIDRFQAESEALAASGSSGITEGSPYMAVEASLNETDRQIRSWFRGTAENLNMSGEQTAMGLESARFGQRAADLDINRLGRQAEEYSDYADEMEESASGLNMALDFFGGFAKTVASVYSIGSSLYAMNTVAGAAGGLGNLSFTDTMRLGGGLKASQLLRDGGASLNSSLEKIGGSTQSYDASLTAKSMMPATNTKSPMGLFSLPSVPMPKMSFNGFADPSALLSGTAPDFSGQFNDMLKVPKQKSGQDLLAEISPLAYIGGGF